MDSTDKNIKKIFSTYTESKSIDLEESVMDSIPLEKNHEAELQQSRKRIKTGMALNVLFLIGYFIFTYLTTFNQINDSIKLVDLYYPTIFTIIVIVIMYFLAIYGLSTLKSKLFNRMM